MDQAAATPIYDELVDEIFKGITESVTTDAEGTATEADAETSERRHREAS